MLDFSALSGGGDGSGDPVIEPRKIFTTLVRDPRFKFPSANQGEVLDKWFAVRTHRDNTIKMNTGSGKMLVGLLALQSSLNEKVGPAVYVAPDKHLVKQVLNEAADLGIKTTEDVNSREYLSGEAILVVNVHKLFNGRSVFGVGEVRAPIGTVVIDDAHACLSTIKDQFMLKIPSDNPVYKNLLAIFSDDLKLQSDLGLIELKAEDPNALMIVPFWAWYDKREPVLSVLHQHRNDGDLQFNWPLIKAVVPFCQCVFGGRGLEIGSRCLPIDKITSFSSAQRRIYMTATLANDDELITHLRAEPSAVSDPIKPKGAGEIGDRMIVAPHEINPETTEAEVKELLVDVAKNKNVTVIVPSERRASFWSDVAIQTLMSGNISDGVEKIRSGSVTGITVLVNRYDGIDLPDDACRLLVIDGLPEVLGLTDRVEAVVLEGTDDLLIRQIQKLEQGMGRGVRSAEDRCAVLLLGHRLTQKISQPSSRSIFTPATLVQMEMGRELTRQLKGKPIKDLKPILSLCIDGDKKWWQAGRERLARAPESKKSNVSNVVLKQREAFDFLVAGNLPMAGIAIQEAVNSESEIKLRGYLRQQLAEIKHLSNPAEAQAILLSANRENNRVLKPLAGIEHKKIKAPAAQASAVSDFLSGRFIDGNALVIYINALASDLNWDENRTDHFESAMRDLGHLLGFGSQCPDKDYRDGGPDNLWAIGGLRFLVIECKSGVMHDGRMISKDHCNQLLGALSWFKNCYDSTCEVTPILVHPSNRFQAEASPDSAMKILDDEKLVALRKAIRGFGAAVAALRNFKDEDGIARLLEQFKFTGASFVTNYTKRYSVQPK